MRSSTAVRPPVLCACSCLALAFLLFSLACVATPQDAPGAKAVLARALPGIAMVRENFDSRVGIKGGHVLEEADGNRFLRTSPGYAPFAILGGPGDMLHNVAIGFRIRKNALAPDAPLGLALRDDGAGKRLEFALDKRSVYVTVIREARRTELARYTIPVSMDLKTWTSCLLSCVGTVLEAKLGDQLWSWELPEAWAGKVLFDLSPSVDVDDVSLDSLDSGGDIAKEGQAWMLPALQAFFVKGPLLGKTPVWLLDSKPLPDGYSVDLRAEAGATEKIYMSMVPAGGSYFWQTEISYAPGSTPLLVLGVGQATMHCGWRMYAGPRGLELSYGDSEGSRVRMDGRHDMRIDAAAGVASLGFVRLRGDGYFLFNGKVAFKVPSMGFSEGRLSFGSLASSGSGADKAITLSSMSLARAPDSMPDPVPLAYDPQSAEERDPFPLPVGAKLPLAGWELVASQDVVSRLAVERQAGREELALSVDSKPALPDAQAALYLPLRADVRTFGGLEFSVKAIGASWIRVELDSPFATDLAHTVSAYVVPGSSWQRIFLPFSAEAFSGDKDFSFSRVAVLRVVFGGFARTGKPALRLAELRLAPKSLATRLERERVLVDFEPDSESHLFPLSAAIMDKADSRDASAQVKAEAGGSSSSSLVLKYDKRGVGQSFYYSIPGMADMSDRDGISFMVRGEGVTRAAVGFTSVPAASAESESSVESYDLAVPVNPRWVRWRVPFAPAAVDAGASGLVSAHVPNSARITKLFVHGYRGNYPDKGTLFVDELAAYESEEPGRIVKIGLPPAIDAGGASALLRTVSDTLALNLERVPGLKLSVLGAEDPKAAAEKAGCSYYLEIVCTAKDGMFNGKATLVQTLGSGRSRPADFRSPVDVDLFDALDKLSESVVNALVGVDLGYEARTERSADTAVFKDPIAQMSDYWLAYGSVARAPVDGRLRVGANGLVLLNEYQEGLSYLAVDVALEEGTLCLYWDYMGYDFWRRLEIDAARNILRLRSSWNLEEARMPSGTFAGGKQLRVQIELSAEATVVRIGGKELARFQPSPRPLGRAGFGLDGSGSAWFFNFESRRIVGSAQDARTSLLSPIGAIRLLK